MLQSPLSPPPVPIPVAPLFPFPWPPPLMSFGPYCSRSSLQCMSEVGVSESRASKWQPTTSSRKGFRSNFLYNLVCPSTRWDLAESRALRSYQVETGHQTWPLSKGWSRVAVCQSSWRKSQKPKVWGRVDQNQIGLAWSLRRTDPNHADKDRLVMRKGPCLQETQLGQLWQIPSNCHWPSCKDFCSSSISNQLLHICKSWTKCVCGSQQSTGHLWASLGFRVRKHLPPIRMSDLLKLMVSPYLITRG